MNDDDLKHLWQTQPVPESGGDMGVLMATVRQKHQKFQRTVLWRDFREAGIGIILIPFFILRGGTQDTRWENHLIVLALVFVVGFLVIDRLRHSKAAAAPGETVVDALGIAITQVEHQIWLLRNVLWWYVGPLIGALIIPVLHRLLTGQGGIVSLILHLLFGYGIWKLNQYAVKKDLEPRRNELQKMLEEAR